MSKPKTYSGFTGDTAKKLLLDAGAYFKNFEVGVDTFDAAVLAGKLLGATSGGGTFSAIPTYRKIEIDGVIGDGKGLQAIDFWKVTIMANMKEISEQLIVDALGTGVSIDGPAGYKLITAKNYVEDTDYIDNITWVGKLSGEETPVIIQVENALSMGGITLATADKGEAVMATTFTGHYDAGGLDEPPFKIYYPVPVAPAG